MRDVVRPRLRYHLRTAAALSCALVVLTGCNGDEDADGAADPEAFCAAAEGERFAAQVEGLDPADVDGSIATLTDALETERRLLADAPDAVRADVETLVRFLDRLVQGLEEADPNSPERPAVYEDLRPEFGQVEAASDRIERYVSTNC